MKEYKVLRSLYNQHQNNINHNNKKRWYIDITHVMDVQPILLLVLDSSVLSVQIMISVKHVKRKKFITNTNFSKLVTLKNLKITRENTVHKVGDVDSMDMDHVVLDQEVVMDLMDNSLNKWKNCSKILNLRKLRIISVK